MSEEGIKWLLLAIAVFGPFVIMNIPSREPTEEEKKEMKRIEKFWNEYGRGEK